MDLRALVAEEYDQVEKCYGHCEQPATSKFLNSEADPVVTGYSCHSAYLSRIIIYSETFGLHESVDLISQIIGKHYDVKEEDVRIASRYAWDLGMTTGDAQKLVTAAYWTQNYRRTKSEDPGRTALFLCENCRSVFSQPLSDKRVICPSCTSERLGS